MESLPGYDNWKTTEPRHYECDNCGANPCRCCLDCDSYPCRCGEDEPPEHEEADEVAVERLRMADEARAINREHQPKY